MNPEKAVIIPDTHGHLDHVERLVGKLEREGYLENRRMVFLGDYVDRGPAVKQLIDYCIGLQAEGHVMLAGNHEYTLLQALDEDHPDRDYWIDRWYHNYEQDTLKSYGVRRMAYYPERTVDRLIQRMPEEHMRFLGSLPWFWESEDVIAIHAGVSAEASWAEQREQLAHRISPPFFGPPQLFSHELAASLTGADGKTIVSGHLSLFKPHVTPERVLLDCGVDEGGPLVAWVSDTQEIVQVD